MMNRRWWTSIATMLLVTAGLLAAAPTSTEAGPGPYHEDKKFGYKVRAPSGWSEIAMSAEEKWIAAKYLSDKVCRYMDKETGFSSTFKPVMQVIVFVESVVNKRGIEEAEDEDGTLWLSLNNPYKNYQDFLKKTYSGGGWFISKEEQSDLKGVKVTEYEIKVEKLSHTGPMRIVTWVFHTDMVDFAVQFEVPEGDYRDFRSDIYACLKSFRSIERDQALGAATTGKNKKKKLESEMTLAERTKSRAESEKEEHRKASEAVTDDWEVKKMGRFLVLNHADRKYAKKTVAHAEAIWDWLEANFDYVGKGEYVRHPILRICKDRDEERAFLDGTSWGQNLEIVTHQDKGSGSMSWEFEYVNTQLVSHWFSERNRDLYWAMPYWLQNGLRQVLGTARAKGRRLEFNVDSWERDGLRKSVREGALTPPKELVMLGSSNFYENENRMKHSAAFIRFLLDARSKKTRQVLHDYIANLQDVVAETVAKEKKEFEARLKELPEAPERPQTEEEEDEAFKARQESYKGKEAEFLKEVFSRTFGTWDDKDWSRLQKKYYKSME